VDRWAILCDVYEYEEAYQSSKMRLLDCYLECYHNCTQPTQQRQLAQLMVRCSFDPSHSHHAMLIVAHWYSWSVVYDMGMRLA
jgi:hypothetical protein